MLSVRQCWATVAVGCLGLLAFGLYLQHAVGLEPCPMCIVQRYLLLLVALLAAAVASWRRCVTARWPGVLLALLSLTGFGVAARQSWLQWYPPAITTCGRDLFGMIETFPLKRALPMIFRGGGDCSAVDWTFLGLSIANWSALNFLFLSTVGAWLFLRTAHNNYSVN